MLAVNYSTIRNNLKNYCDEATDNNEVVIVTRKEEKNVSSASITITSLPKPPATQNTLPNLTAATRRLPPVTCANMSLLRTNHEQIMD